MKSDKEKLMLWKLIYVEKLEAVLKSARLVAYSLPRSAQIVRLVSKLKEKIEELDRV